LTELQRFRAEGDDVDPVYCDSVLLPITALLKHFGKISLRKFDVLLEKLRQFGELFRTGFYGGVNDPIAHRTDPFCQRSILVNLIVGHVLHA
jgi:hypothetical protein